MWKQWNKTGLSVTKSTGDFDQFFLEAAANADTIHFDLSFFDRTVQQAIKEGAAGYKAQNYTNRELYLLSQNSELWEKVIFYP